MGTLSEPYGERGRLDRDLDLYRRAFKERWPVPDKARQEVMQLARKVVTGSRYRPRERLAAAKLIIEADKLNISATKEAPAGDTTTNNNTLNVHVHGTVGISGAIEQAKRLIAEFRAGGADGEVAGPDGVGEGDGPATLGTATGAANGGASVSGG